MSRPNVLMTTGDYDGIGLEVSVKALGLLPRKVPAKFHIFAHKNTPPRHLRWALSELKKKHSLKKFESLEKSLSDFSDTSVHVIISDRSPAHWVESAAQLCVNDPDLAMVTAPLSKPEIKKAGLSDIGHTQILQRVCGKPLAFMCFLGAHFNVVLATGHESLGNVSKALTYEVHTTAIQQTQNARLFLAAKKSKLPLGLLALNPHAGDDGLIGDFEKRSFPKILNFCQRQNIPVVGPLVPDVAFQKQHWSKYSFYVACYHDQGLIPFKSIHGFSGVHVTLGLPLIRTSVDHGTAKDIFAKNIANPTSMKEAIETALRMVR